MNIPEYAKIVRVNKKNTSTILGEHFDANILLYEILTIFGISGETHSIALDTSRASNGMIRYRIKPLDTNSSVDMSYIKDNYNNTMISLFGKTYITTTKLSNDVLIITMYEK
ncbi:MAG: hypothetical protein IJ880_15880 [Bacilli bacterium]|nr:hypothetical protein [Bacilli bacterium]